MSVANLRIQIDANTKKLTEIENKIDKIKTKGKNVDGGGFKKMAIGAMGAVSALVLVEKSIEAVYAVAKKAAVTFAEFEQFRNVLETAFGNRADANLAMQQIQDFAAKTPYDVQQLTAAYIKLKNRGITPTTKELTKMGDISASQGKSMDQFVEATLDSMSGQNDRLNEFGIKAKTVGNKVSFTFRGVTKTVEKTEDAIKNALFSFGEMKGIAGSMSGMSVTLKGQYSNLQDNTTELFKLIGDKLQPTLLDLVSVANSILSFFKDRMSREEKIEQIYKNIDDINKRQIQVGSGKTDEEKAAYNDLIKIFPSLGDSITKDMFGTDMFAEQLQKNIDNLTQYTGTTIGKFISKSGDDLNNDLRDSESDVASLEAEIINYISELSEKFNEAGKQDVVTAAMQGKTLNEQLITLVNNLTENSKFYDMNRKNKLLAEYEQAKIDLENYRKIRAEKEKLNNKQLEDIKKQMGDKKYTDLMKLIGQGEAESSSSTSTSTTSAKAEESLTSALTSKQNVYTINVNTLLNVEEWDSKLSQDDSKKLMDDMITNALQRLLNDTTQN